MRLCVCSHVCKRSCLLHCDGGREVWRLWQVKGHVRILSPHQHTAISLSLFSLFDNVVLRMITVQDWEHLPDVVDVARGWVARLSSVVWGKKGGCLISLVQGAGWCMWSVVRVAGWWDGGGGLEAWRQGWCPGFLVLLPDQNNYKKYLKFLFHLNCTHVALLLNYIAQYLMAFIRNKPKLTPEKTDSFFLPLYHTIYAQLGTIRLNKQYISVN